MDHHCTSCDHYKLFPGQKEKVCEFGEYRARGCKNGYFYQWRPIGLMVIKGEKHEGRVRTD